MSHIPIRSVLAIDVRSQRVGYAIFEAPARLLDWGVRKNIGRHACDRAIPDLLRMFQPSVVVLRRMKVGGRRDTPGARSITRAIRSNIRRLSIPMVYLNGTVLKKFFRAYDERSKYAIASLLAICFPELKWKLPPRRKIWKAEPLQMSIFDAVQLGVVFLASRVDGDVVRQLLVRVESFRRPPDGAAK